MLLVTNGTLLHKRQRLFESLDGLIVSLDALTADPENPKSKPGVLSRVLENLDLAKQRMRRPGDITISTVIEEWNIPEIERILDFCGEQGFVFATQTALHEKMPNLRLKRNPRYQALVEKIVERRRERKQPINGTPKLLRTVLEFGDFKCFPTMFPARLPQRRRLLSLRTTEENCRQFAARGFVQESLRPRPQALRRHSRLPRDLPSLWECRFFVLREGFLGTGGRFHPVRDAERTARKVKRQSAKGKSEKSHNIAGVSNLISFRAKPCPRRAFRRG